MLFLLQYQSFMRGFHDIVPVYAEDVWTVFAERFVVPFKLLAAWISSLVEQTSRQPHVSQRSYEARCIPTTY